MDTFYRNKNFYFPFRVLRKLKMTKSKLEAKDFANLTKDDIVYDG